MRSQQEIVSGLFNLFFENIVISIAGKSGTGKTTLVQMVVGNLLTASEPYEDSCIWVQASEVFTPRRMETLFRDHPEATDYILNNLYPIPAKRTCQSYEEQSDILSKIFNYPNKLPPDLKCIVIDNISNHLRYIISQNSNIHINSNIKENFYENQLFPLIMFCTRNNILLFLIHEATYDPKLKETKAFYHGLYDRITHLQIFLETDFHGREHIITLKSKEFQESFSYNIEDRGFIFKG